MESGNIKFDEDTQEFLFYSYFGNRYETLAGDLENAEHVCFNLAYRDFCRTLEFKDENKENDFPDFVWENGENGLKNEIKKILVTDDSQKNFDSQHERICNLIKSNALRSKYLKQKDTYPDEFTYGQAQKWLNMTLKYMYMMGLWKDKFKNVKNFLHVPLDQYILEAAFNKTMRNKIDEEQKLILVDGDFKEKCYVYSGGELNRNLWESYKKSNKDKLDWCKEEEFAKNCKGSVTWSKLDTYEDYKVIEEKIKECICSQMYPLEWENKVWMASAEIKNKRFG